MKFTFKYKYEDVLSLEMETRTEVNEKVTGLPTTEKNNCEHSNDVINTVSTPYNAKKYSFPGYRT